MSTTRRLRRAGSTKRLSAAAGLLFAVGCSDSSTVETVGFDMTVSVALGSSRVSCASLAEIESLEISLLLRGTRSEWPGFPQRFGCDQDSFTFSGITPGEYTVDIKGLGPLDGDAMAVIYSAVQDISLPATETVDVLLSPEVGFLDLSWTFGDDNLAPCANEVGPVAVFIGTPGGQAGAYSGRFGCTESPVRIPRPFAAQEYVIEVEALSPQDNLRLFIHRTQRFLVRGDNEYRAVLEPLGGRVHLDWQFAVGADEFTDCDAPVVGVSEIAVEIQSREGGGGVDRATASCLDAPYGFIGNRYTEGRMLTAVLTAEGVHRFEAVQDFDMPEGDYDSGRLTLHAVGTATLAATVMTATCAADGVTGYDVTAAGPVDFAFQTNEPNAPVFPLSGLRYGAYDIEVAQMTAAGVQCRARGQRRISRRDNSWAPLEF